jgi:purine-binding chemotaxis protein CheW
MEATMETPASGGHPGGPPPGALGREEDTVGQYVTFYIEKEFFAFPLASVLEIIRVPETVKVPLAPRGLVGLANLRGTVLPILDLRRILALPETPYGEATRVVVTDVGSPVGLVVDRVAQVLNVDREKIESAEAVQSTIQADLLTGVVKDVAGHSLVQLLDVQRCVSLELDAMMEQRRAAASAGGGAARAERADDREDAVDDASLQIVSFVVDGQEYAFPIRDVEEIVRVPEGISRVPRAEANVLGLINLRNRLLPLVGMRRIFGLPESEHSESQRILVVTLDGGQQHESVGIVVDQVREVLRVEASAQDRMPSILSRDGAENRISCVCRLDDGKRLVSVLSSQALFQHKAVQAAMDASTRSAAGEATGAEQQDGVERDEDEKKLVVFLLADQEYGVMVESVREIIRVPEEMSRVPKTAEFIEGMVNLRGSVLPVLDMRLRFGMERTDRADRQRILVFSEGGTSTGFIVDSVSEVLRLTRAVIEDAPRLSDDQARIMGRVANLREQKRMIQILEVRELVSAEELSRMAEVRGA